MRVIDPEALVVPAVRESPWAPVPVPKELAYRLIELPVQSAPIKNPIPPLPFPVQAVAVMGPLAEQAFATDTPCEAAPDPPIQPVTPPGIAEPKLNVPLLATVKGAPINTPWEPATAAELVPLTKVRLATPVTALGAASKTPTLAVVPED